ncbi:hypothetical protein MO973_10245 [Paenibacillus sp. TRM 82003]|nr:hypothetical protein [Paenibacillus sp. TRM 82003]
MSPVTAPTQVVYENIYHPSPVQIVHPINIVKRHHCIPVPYHTVAVTVTEEMAQVCGAKRKKRMKSKK